MSDPWPLSRTSAESQPDLDEQRIADMDANGVDVQLLLLTSPGVQIFDADHRQMPALRR